jgi:hypothetical protein
MEGGAAVSPVEANSSAEEKIVKRKLTVV